MSQVRGVAAYVALETWSRCSRVLEREVVVEKVQIQKDHLMRYTARPAYTSGRS